MIKFFILLFCLFASNIVYAASENSCNALLRHGLSDISKKYGSNHSVVLNYQKHCGFIDNSTSDRLVLQAEAELFGVAGGDTNTEVTRARRRIENWCNTNKDFAESHSRYSEEVSTINTAALQAFATCQKFQTREIFVDVQRSDEFASNVTITLDSQSNGDYRFTGMAIKGFDCNYFTDNTDQAVGKSLNKKITTNDRLNIPIKNGNIHIDCTRKSPKKIVIEGVGKIKYNHASIRVFTNDLALLLSYPEIVDTYYVTPPSSIVAIAGPNCPAGWSVFKDGIGRFLVGAGKVNGQDFKLSTKGGSASHKHSGNTSYVGGVRKDDDGDDSHATGPHTHAFTTNAEKHIPPYVAVTYCYRKP